MTNTRPVTIEATVSAPYHVIGYQGGRYGASQFAKRDYTATVLGHKVTNTSKAEFQSRVRLILSRDALATGWKVGKVTFNYTQEV